MMLLVMMMVGDGCRQERKKEGKRTVGVKWSEWG